MNYLVSQWNTKNKEKNTFYVSREITYILDNIFFWGTIADLVDNKLNVTMDSYLYKNLFYFTLQQPCTVCGKEFSNTDTIVARMLVGHHEFYWKLEDFFVSDYFSIVHLETCEDLRLIRNVL